MPPETLPATRDDASTDLVLPGEIATGLEDFDVEDFVMPRITIDHKKGVFVDGLSGEEFNEFEAIVLGLVKGRILWATEISEGASKAPMCKSYNFKEGVPGDTFPWEASGFDQSQVGDDPLTCSACPLKEWDSHPTRDTPWCSEQHTFPILTKVGGGWAPAILTIQRSAIKGSKAYLTAFARSGSPLFTVVTKLSLDVHKRGSVDYAVPKFVRGEDTEADQFPYYAEQYRTIREYITTPRVRGVEAQATKPDASTPAEQKQDDSAPKNAAPAAAIADEDDLPF